MDQKVKRILILAANPKGTTPLRLSEEVREIDLGIQRHGTKNYELRSLLAARPRDVRREMLDFVPDIVHFCGHGDGKNGIAFEDNSGETQLISTEALSSLFELFSEQVNCIVLNACYSHEQASAIAEHINYVVGMTGAIHDKHAIEFSIGFYDALVAGHGIESAFKFGRNALLMAGCRDSTACILYNKRSMNGSGGGVSESLLAKNTLEPAWATRVDLIVGFTYDCPMFFLNHKSEMEGFAFDLAQILAKRMGKRFVPKMVFYPQVAAKLASHEIDIAISGFIPHPGHGANIRWSDPYLAANFCLIVHQDSDLTCIEDLSGHTIGVYDEPFVIDWVSKNLPSVIVKTYAHPSWYDCIKTFEVDAIINDYPYAVENIKHHPELKFADYHVTDANYSICLPDDTAVRNEVNRILAAVKSTDAFKRLHNKYLYIKDAFLDDKFKVLPYRSTYKTRGNDDLYSLARKLLGDEARWQEIYEVNKHVIPNPFVIEPNIVLYIPE